MRGRQFRGLEEAVRGKENGSQEEEGRRTIKSEVGSSICAIIIFLLKPFMTVRSSRKLRVMSAKREGLNRDYLLEKGDGTSN